MRKSQCDLFSKKTSRKCEEKELYIPGKTNINNSQYNSSFDMLSCNFCFTEINSIPNDLKIKKFLSR